LRVRSVSREEIWASAGVHGAWVGGCGCEADKGVFVFVESEALEFEFARRLNNRAPKLEPKLAPNGRRTPNGLVDLNWIKQGTTPTFCPQQSEVRSELRPFLRIAHYTTTKRQKPSELSARIPSFERDRPPGGSPISWGVTSGGPPGGRSTRRPYEVFLAQPPPARGLVRYSRWYSSVLPKRTVPNPPLLFFFVKLYSDSNLFCCTLPAAANASPASPASRGFPPRRWTAATVRRV